MKEIERHLGENFEKTNGYRKGKEIAEEKDYSERTAVIIDQEVRALLQISLQQAEEIIKRNRHALDRLAQALMEKEVLGEMEVEKLLSRMTRKKKEAQLVSLTSTDKNPTGL